MADEAKPTLGRFQTSFVLYLGQDEETKEWGIVVQDIAAQKQNAFTRHNLGAAMKEAQIRVRKRELQNRKFPIPEPSRIISLEHEVKRFIVGPDGKPLTNGH